MKKIQLLDISNPVKLENYIDSHMVDIVYIDEIKNDSISLLIEPAIDIDKPDDKMWLQEILQKAFIECQEDSVKIIWQQ